IVGERRVTAEPGATGEVLTACAGLPLAIRIAGARLATRGNWSIATLASRLADERRRLDELRVGNLAIRASFEVSFATLPGPAAPAAAAIPAQQDRVPLGPPPANVQPLGFGSLEDALAWCDAERPGLVAATRLAASSGQHEVAWKLAAAAMSFYYRRSHWDDW